MMKPRLTLEEYNKLVTWKEVGFDFVRITVGEIVMLSTVTDGFIEHNSEFRINKDIAAYYGKVKVAINELLRHEVAGRVPSNNTAYNITPIESDVDRLERIKRQTPYDLHIMKSASTGATTQERIEYIVSKGDWEFLLRQAQRLQDLNQAVNSIIDTNYKTPNYSGVPTILETFE